MENKALILYTFGDICSCLSDFHTVKHKKRQSLITLTKVNMRIKNQIKTQLKRHKNKLISVTNQKISLRKVLLFVPLNMDQIYASDLDRFLQICLNKTFLKTHRKEQAFSHEHLQYSALCFTENITSERKCIDNVGFVSIQDAVFNIKNAGQKNTALIFLIGVVWYKL